MVFCFFLFALLKNTKIVKVKSNYLLRFILNVLYFNLFLYFCPKFARLVGGDAMRLI